jgi:lipoprotein-anchoring transpeptidase ErfK/SrfK
MLTAYLNSEKLFWKVVMKFFYSFCLILIFASLAITAIQERMNDAIKLQVLLDRANFSPGEIDGSIGSNTLRALQAFQQAHNLQSGDTPDPDTLAALEQNGVEPTITYTIQPQDVQGPFAEKIPTDWMEMAKLKSLDYTSPVEELGEKFHANPNLLKRLNPNAQFKPGEEIIVPNVLGEDGATQTQTQPQSQPKSRQQKNGIKVVVSQSDSTLMVENGSDEILFFAPVTAGSVQDPLPLGTWKVTGLNKNPEFNYNPELIRSSKPGDTKATIAPGPNNPVGVLWIDIDKEHYGIHGSPEPSKIGKTESNGCVRLTNWDIQRLAKFVKPGTTVLFQ